MLGFLPGFAYLGSVDDDAARRPRDAIGLRVPAGSVGDRGRANRHLSLRFTGRMAIIGRSPLRVFDPERTPAALLQARRYGALCARVFRVC